MEPSSETNVYIGPVDEPPYVSEVSVRADDSFASTSVASTVEVRNTGSELSTRLNAFVSI